MRYSLISAAFVALASSVYAQTAGFDAISVPTQDQEVPAGSTLDVTWDPNGVTGTVTITLLQGATFNTLELGAVLASSIDNTLGKYSYSVPSSSAFATYGFKIELDSTANDPTPTFQYSKPFHIAGGSSASGSGSGSASATGSGSASGTSTTTVKLSTGPSYTSSSAVSTSASLSSSSTVVKTSSSASTTVTSVSSSNLTLSTTLKTSSGSHTSTGSSSGTSSTSSGASTATGNAAVANMATGGIAMIGGMLVALAL